MPEVTVNGRRVRVGEGCSVAAAIYMAGETTFRQSEEGQPRAPLCGMGICMECRVTIDRRPHQRSCQIAVAEGMAIETA